MNEGDHMGNGMDGQKGDWLPADSHEEELFRRIDPAAMPRHVAIIMDGNGRWAKGRDLPRIRGHEAGIDSVREIVETSAHLGLDALTLYAFSAENWKRPKNEVDALMGLLKIFLRREIERLHKNNIRFDTIGRTGQLAPDVQAELADARAKTLPNTGMRFFVALSYSGRAEIVDACSRIAREAAESGRAPQVTEEMFAANLYAPAIPDPDLLIRTSGELRVSNFLLWQIAYAEIWVTPVLWPDFRTLHLFEAILDFQSRERRYGDIHGKRGRG